MVVTAESLPLGIVTGPGDEHNVRRLVEVVGSMRVKHGIERSLSRPRWVYADSAYDSKRIRSYLRHRGIRVCIPINPRSRRKPKRGRPYGFDEMGYGRLRSAVERFSAWLKSFRRLTVRYERLAATFPAFIQVASIPIYLRVLQ